MSRHLAIGDIHGCITALRSLVDVVEPGSSDTIVTLGDYVDRGPDSCAVVDFIMALGEQHQVITLRGNHEIMMLDARDKKSWLQPWLSYGGEATLNSYGGSFDGVPAAHFDFLENRLVSYYECDTHFFVHANADADVALDDQSDAALYWRKYSDPPPHCSNKVMVCGHTSQRSGLPRGNGHSVCIDTWACGEGWLSCLDVDSGTIWQANEAGETRSFELDG
ncbi:MAG: metallophosphoesterase family protein [Woeseiaceae bacterium]